MSGHGFARFIFVALCVALASLASSAPALAQEAPAVTLEASRTRMRFGVSTVLSGAVSPATPSQPIQIVAEDGSIVAQTTTNDEGKYRVRVTPRSNVTVRAQWLAVMSDPVTLKVRPLLTARLRDVRLFGKAKVRGTLRPAHRGHRVKVRLVRRGVVVARRSPRLREGRRFVARFRIRRPGRYRAKVSFDDADHLRARDRTRARTTPLPSLSVGSRNIYVKLLEKRLRALNYHLTGINRRYDYRTADAVRAFNKVQGRARVGSVDASTWRALADPRRPRPRSTRPRFHIEVNQSKQVLYVVREGRVRKILHVSTGAGGATRDGVFHVYRKLAGYSPNRLYYPSYFDGLRAIHGWPDVPPTPASHGCVRVPMWSARWMFGVADLGTQIRIYH